MESLALPDPGVPLGFLGVLIQVKEASNVMPDCGQKTVTWRYIRVLLHLTKGKTVGSVALFTFRLWHGAQAQEHAFPHKS